MPAASPVVPATPFAGVAAVDGPSGSGKSTVAKALARRLNARYLDTGAMYRAVAAAVLRAGVDPADAEAVLEVADRVTVEISTDPDEATVSLDGADVTTEIRGSAVTAAVSAVSAVPAVRDRLVAQQRRLIGAGGIVVEGRDIASVVWPDAAPKVYLTAAAQVRAQRRAAEGAGAVRDVALDLDRRDRFDSSRAASPLARADGAVEVDTTDLDVEAVVNVLADLVNRASPTSA